MPKRFALSDIHGNAKSFQRLVENLQLQKGDELFLLGDYIDRGPDSKGVIDFIWKLESWGIKVQSLRGNHEQIMLDARKRGGDYAQHWIQRSGGEETLRSFGPNIAFEEVDDRYWQWMENLPFYLELPHYFLVHAGLNFRAEKPLEERESMIWIRRWYDDFVPAEIGGRRMLHGHTPQYEEDIRLRKDQLDSFPVLNIDNGCYQYDRPGRGQLCAFDMNAETLHFQENIDISQYRHDLV